MSKTLEAWEEPPGAAVGDAVGDAGAREGHGRVVGWFFGDPSSCFFLGGGGLEGFWRIFGKVFWESLWRSFLKEC